MDDHLSTPNANVSGNPKRSRLYVLLVAVSVLPVGCSVLFAPDSDGSAPFFTIEAMVQVSDAQTMPTDAHFGWSVAIDGDTAVVGAYQATGAPGSTSVTGAAYVFVRSGTTWNQQAILRAVDAQGGDQFGTSVAISGDTIVVGANWEDGGSGDPMSMAGAAYVFTRTGSVWSQQATLRASDATTEDQFGYSVTISDDTIFVGAPREDGGPGSPDFDSGAVYVFTREGTMWSEQTILRASDVDGGDRFGASLAISNDTVVVGAHLKGGGVDPYPIHAGVVYVFVGSGSSWTEQTTLKASNAQADAYFGSAVAISRDTVVVGAPGEHIGIDYPMYNAGVAYVFSRSGAAWSEQAVLRAPDPQTTDLFGAAVAVSGETAVIGAPREDHGNGDPVRDAGAAYIVTRNGSQWDLREILRAPQAQAAGRFGNSLALQGSTLVVGEYWRFREVNFARIGAAYLYR